MNLIIIIIFIVSMILMYTIINNLMYEKIYLMSENDKLKLQVSDLQRYQDDISKTFKVLDNELVAITKKLNEENAKIESETTTPSTNANSSNLTLTPQILNSLFENVNQETTTNFNDLLNRFIIG
jgi:predicted nuclease with TOPRIM domain